MEHIPPYKFSVIRNEQAQLLATIMDALPTKFEGYKNQFHSIRLLSFDNWVLFPDFQFISFSYPRESIFQFKRRKVNFKILGITIYSKRNQKFEEVEILIISNLIKGLKITNSDYNVSEFDLKRIDANKAQTLDIEAPPASIDIFIESLDGEIKGKLDVDKIEEIDFNNRTYYSIYNLEDGNYLVMDKNEQVYSLVHDAIPKSKKMKASLREILNDISSGKFDAEEHLDERYSNSK